MALHLQCTITLLHPYNGHISGIFPDVHVIFKSHPTYGIAQNRPTTPGGPLRPDRRRPWGSTDHFSSGRLCRPVFTCLRLPTRGPTRRASPCLLLTSASLLLTSCLRAPSATGQKVVSPTLCTARKLLGPSMHNQ